MIKHSAMIRYGCLSSQRPVVGQIELTPKQHKDEFWEVFRKLRAPPLAAVPTLTGNADGPGPKVARDGQKSAEVGMTDAWMVKLQRIQVRIPAVGMDNCLQPW